MTDKRIVTPGPKTIRLMHLVTSEHMQVGTVPDITFCGACNILDADGSPIRNRGRDSVIFWAEKQGLSFFEVQVHPTTHGREYIYEIDGPSEQKAREEAKLRVYEIRSDVTGIVTFTELLQDAALGRVSIVWLRTGWQKFRHPFAGTISDIKTNTELRDEMEPLHHGLYLQLLKQAETQRRTVVDFITKSRMSESSNLIFVDGDNVDDVVAAIKKALNLA